MSEKRKKRKIGWLIALLIIAALVGSYAVAMTNADIAETILKGWIIVGMIAMPIVSILGLITRRKMYIDAFRRIEEADKAKKAEEQRRIVKYEEEIKAKNYFANSNLEENRQRELNFYVNKAGFNRVLLDETSVSNIVTKLLEMGERGFGKETYCYCGVSDREKKFILTRYGKGKFEGQEGIHDENYIVLYGANPSDYKVILLKSKTDAWGDIYEPCRVGADPGNIYSQVKEYIMPAIAYLNKADGYETFQNEIEEIFHISCAEYEWKNYIQVFKKHNEFIFTTEALRKQIMECVKRSEYDSECTWEIEYGLYNKIEDIFMAQCGGISEEGRLCGEPEDKFFVFIIPYTSFVIPCRRSAKEGVEVCGKYLPVKDSIIEEMVLYYEQNHTDFKTKQMR